MTMIQKDLQPVCKALNLDVDSFANARTVFIDRDSVGRILSYMSDHEINPEWYGLLPDNLFVGTGLPVLTGVEGEYFARMTGRNLTKKVAAKTFIADMEAYWLSKDNLKRTDGTKNSGTTLGFGRCSGLREVSRYNERIFKNNEYEYTNPVDEYGIDTVSRYRQVGEIYNEVGQCFKGMAQARTPLAPFVFLTHKEYEGGLDTVVNHCPYITHSDATRIIDGMKQFPPKRSVDRFMLRVHHDRVRVRHESGRGIRTVRDGRSETTENRNQTAFRRSENHVAHPFETGRASTQGHAILRR